MRHSAQLVLTALDRRDNIALVLAPTERGRRPTIAEANDAFRRISRFDAARLEGAPLNLLAGSLTDNAAWQRLVAAIETAQPLDGEIALATAEGPSFWFGFALTHVRDAATGRIQAVLTGRDITEQRRQRHEQETMQQLLASVFLKVDAAVMLARANGTIASTNPALQALTGYSAEQLEGMHVRRLTAPADQEAAAAAQARQFAGAPRYSMRLRLQHRSGRLVPVRVTSVLIDHVPPERFRVVTLHADGGPAEEAAPPVAIATADIGRVQVISLDAIRKAYGEGWETAASGLMMLAETVLKRRLAPRDVFARSTGQGFVIWFAEGSEDDNAARTAAIAREIRIRLLGEFGEHPGIRVSAQSARVAVDHPASPPDPARLPGLDLLLTQRARRLEDGARALLQDIAEDPPVELLQVTDRHQRPSPYAWADLPPPARRRIDGALAVLGGGEALLDLDGLRLRMALDGLVRDMAEGLNQTWLVPVAAERLLSRRLRETYLEQLRDIGGAARHKLLLLVADLPNGIPQSRVQEALGLLAPLVQGVGLLATLPDLPPEPLLQLPLAMIAIDTGSGGAPAEEVSFTLIGKARQRNLPVLVRTAHPGQTLSWRELGVTLFAGTAAMAHA